MCARSGHRHPNVEAQECSLVFVRRTTLAGQRYPEECSTYAMGRITHVADSRLGEKIHFIAQRLKKAFLERTCLKAQLTACLAVVAKVS